MTDRALAGGGGNWRTDGTAASVFPREPVLDVVARIVSPPTVAGPHVVQLTDTALADLGVSWGEVVAADIQSARRVLVLVARLVDALRTLDSRS